LRLQQLRHVVEDHDVTRHGCAGKPRPPQQQGPGLFIVLRAWFRIFCTCRKAADSAQGARKRWRYARRRNRSCMKLATSILSDASSTVSRMEVACWTIMFYWKQKI
jgi:hypothetical protein